MFGFYELHCRANLISAFKLCCLGVFNGSTFPPAFIVTLPDLASDQTNFTSAVRRVQTSLAGIPNVTALFSNPRLVAPIFVLLGTGKRLLEDLNHSVRDVSSSCKSRRRRLQKKLESRFICTVADEEREWASMDANPKFGCSTTVSPTPRVVSGTRNSPKAPNPKFVELTHFPVRSKASTSSP